MESFLSAEKSSVLLACTLSPRMISLGARSASSRGLPNFSLQLLLLCLVSSASALSWSQQAILPPLVTNSTEGFVVALSADGNTLAVGSPSFNITEPSYPPGFVQVYARSGSTWSLQATLSQGNPLQSVINEGTSVSLSADGNLLAVGAPHSFQCGQVYIYTRAGQDWSYNNTISPSCVPFGARLFGQSVSLSASGNVLAIGAPFSGINEAGWTVIYVQSAAS